MWHANKTLVFELRQVVVRFWSRMFTSIVLEKMLDVSIIRTTNPVSSARGRREKGHALCVESRVSSRVDGLSLPQFACALVT